MKIEYLNHAKDCVWCETRSKEMGYSECCDDCPRKDKENCPIVTDIGDSVEYYKAVETALEKQIPKEPAPPPEHTGTAKPFPFEPKDDVIYGGQLHRVRDVGKARMILCRNADLKGATIMLDDYNAGRADVRKVGEKPPIKTAGEDIMLKRRRQDEEPEGVKAPETIFERVTARKADRKPATVNQGFEELFKPINQVVEEAEVAATIESAPNNVEPIHIDLEMDDIGDDPAYQFDAVPGNIKREISDTVLSRREYMDKIDQLLDLMISDCKDPEMAYQVRKLACFTLITGIEGEIAAKYPAEVTAHER
jgi:hypothetical protein